MHRALARLVFVVAFGAVTGAAVHAQDFECKKAGGCTAKKPENGGLVEVQFRKGDLINTGDGWIVDPDDGWKKLAKKR